MALVMAENEQPVFRDFLGLDRGVTSKQQQQQQQRQAEECYTSATTTTTSDVILRATSRSSVGFDSEGDVGTNRGSSETGGRFGTSSAPGYIAPLFGLALPSSSDPGSEVPQLLHSGNNNNSGSLLQVLTPLPPSLRISHLGACAEREESRAAAAAAVVVSRDNNAGMSPPIITRPAADEGSQTGLKGSSLLAGLINNNSTPAVPAAGSSGPPPLPRRPVKPAPSATRKLLTIFYGGQAHVFDDVPSNKAEAILAMAGLHGKSWSSTYLPRPAVSVPDSAQEGSLSVLEKEKTVQSLRGGSVSGGRGLPLSTDVQALLRGCVNTANGTARPT
ncbi:unnamed protein product [Sphagnum troendelagicum]|uniref:Tify domain-containing protein n=1 Tax=Sphagnum troendelagicum TaxID=128251 RepID=A0ABP0TT88_9BRYO